MLIAITGAGKILARRAADDYIWLELADGPHGGFNVTEVKFLNVVIEVHRIAADRCIPGIKRGDN